MSTTPRIARMVVHFHRPGQKPRKVYPIGSTRQRGNTIYIKQEVIAYEWGKPVGYATRRGKHLTEWVVKDSKRDRNSPNFKYP